MTDAELKLELFRLIDLKNGNELKLLYNSLIAILDKTKPKKQTQNISVEEQYKLMSQDIGREKEAIEWIEGTHNFNSL